MQYIINLNKVFFLIIIIIIYEDASKDVKSGTKCWGTSPRFTYNNTEVVYIL